MLDSSPLNFLLRLIQPLDLLAIRVRTVTPRLTALLSASLTTGSSIRNIVMLIEWVALSIAVTIGKKLSPGWTIRDRFLTSLYGFIKSPYRSTPQTRLSYTQLVFRGRMSRLSLVFIQLYHNLPLPHLTFNTIMRSNTTNSFTRAILRGRWVQLDRRSIMSGTVMMIRLI